MQVVKKEEEKRQSIPHLRETYEFEITAVSDIPFAKR